MNKINKLLIAALVIQTGLVVLLWFMHARQSYNEGSSRLVVDMKKDDITSLEVVAKANKDGDPPDVVKLAKKDGKWVVASADDYAADGEKVVKVIDKLLEMKVRDPISTNPANHDSLRVGEKDFGRKVTVESKGKKVSFVLGSGSGSSAHVRFDGEKEVYKAPGASVWSISSGARSYIDTKLVDIDKDKMSSVVVTNEKGTLTFKKDGDTWSLAELPAGAILDDGKVKSLMGKVSSVSLNDVLGKTIKPEYGLDKGAKVVVVATIDGAPKTTSYTVGAKKDDSYFYGKVDGNDYVVTLSKWSTDQIREKAATDFVKEEKKDKESDDAAAPKIAGTDPKADKGPKDMLAKADSKAKPGPKGPKAVAPKSEPTSKTATK